MKRSIAIALTVCLLCGLPFTLTACGEDAAPAPAPEPPAADAPAEDAAPAQQDSAAVLPAEEEKPVVTKSPAAEEAPADEPSEPTALETALSLVDQDVSLLIEALGEPQNRYYETSCSGPGDDGIWTYDGLTVFTYVENGVEIVVDAEAE